MGKFPSIDVPGSTVVQNTEFVLLLSSRSLSGGFLLLILVLVFSCPGVPLLCLLIFQDAS